MEKLYDLHPLFEFFLTFYVGYLISNELRSTVIKALTAESRRIKTKGDNHLHSFVVREKELKDNVEELIKLKADLKGEFTFDEKKVDGDINNIKERIKSLDADITHEFGLRIRNNEYERDFTKTLEPLAALTFFSVLYSFSVLILNGIEYEPKETASILFSFNIITIIFFLLMFTFSLFGDKSIFFKLTNFTSKSIIVTSGIFVIIAILT